MLSEAEPMALGPAKQQPCQVRRIFIHGNNFVIAWSDGKNELLARMIC